MTNRALAALARVLRSGERLVAVTNSAAHLQELGALLGVERERSTFSAENGEHLLRKHFARVQRHEAYGSLVFPSRREAQEYVDAAGCLWGAARRLPELEGPLRVTRAPVVFVAERR